MAAHAGPREPAQSDAVAGLHPFRELTHRFNDTHRLVPGDQREDRVAPLVVDHREVGMADPAGLDADLHLLRTQRAGLIVEWPEGSAAVGRGPGMEGF